MAMTREKFFECTFKSDLHQQTTHIRAWTAADAKRMFLELLADDGIEEPGKVAVNPVHTQAPALSAAIAVLQPRHA